MNFCPDELLSLWAIFMRTYFIPYENLYLNFAILNICVRTFFLTNFTPCDRTSAYEKLRTNIMLTNYFQKYFDPRISGGNGSSYVRKNKWINKNNSSEYVEEINFDEDCCML